MNGASDQPEEFGVQPEQGRQEEPQSNADSTSDATASPEDSTSSAPHSRRVRRRMSAEHIRQIKRKRRRRKILIGVLVIVAALAVFFGARFGAEDLRSGDVLACVAEYRVLRSRKQGLQANLFAAVAGGVGRAVCGQ